MIILIVHTQFIHQCSTCLLKKIDPSNHKETLDRDRTICFESFGWEKMSHLLNKKT